MCRGPAINTHTHTHTHTPYNTTLGGLPKNAGGTCSSRVFMDVLPRQNKPDTHTHKHTHSSVLRLAAPCSSQCSNDNKQCLQSFQGNSVEQKDFSNKPFN
ncbi:uncharacterized protein ACO6RY_11241 [Pungitius sinensis]